MKTNPYVLNKSQLKKPLTDKLKICEKFVSNTTNNISEQKSLGWRLTVTKINPYVPMYLRHHNVQGN